MVQTFLPPVIEKLVDLLVQEVKLSERVRRELWSLKGELEIIQPFLKDAEAKWDKEQMSDGAKVWLIELRQVAKRIEDTIDEYIRQAAQRRQQSGFLRFLYETSQFVKQLKARHGIVSEVQDIKLLLLEINGRGKSYGLRPFEYSFARYERCDHLLNSSLIEEEEVVGIDSTREDLIRTLVEGASTRTVISLLGTGGVGKTTLARKVYNNEVVKAHIDCCAWITVSQSYNMEELLKSLIKQIIHTDADAECTNGKTDTIEDSSNFLRQYLDAKRYVVVFDDVWDIDIWHVINRALPLNEKGSRIIITTRNGSIAAGSKETSCDIVHKVQPLSHELACELFCRKAYRTENNSLCPKELEELSLKIVRKCEGLPLLITAIASLLSTKEKIMLEWQTVLDNWSYVFVNNPQLASVLKILSLSYTNLPYHLKHCFSYFGIFPEDYPISDARLYRLWIAEGFVRPRRDKTAEDVAKEYLEELILRNLVQVSYPKGPGYDRMCKVHDIIRSIILSKADDLDFCQILDEETSRKGTNYRRLSIRRGLENVQEIVENSGVRSILIFNVAELKKSSVVTLFEKCKILILLDFENVPLEDLPNELGNLFHLKYLSLKNTKVKRLPKSVGKLQNLQTLDLRNSLLIELPIEINKLQNLQYLLAGGNDDKISSDSTHGVRIKEGVGSWEKLQTLMTVDARLSGFGLIRKLDKLRHLRRLGISRLTIEVASALCVCIWQMIHLESLSLHWENNYEVLNYLQTISPPPHNLRRLVLNGPLEKLPDWISSLQNLSMLCLSFSRLINDPLVYLCCLPNLVSLWLYRAYDGEQLHFEKGGFPKLKLLVLRELHGLKDVEIDEGALPCLEELRIGSSLLLNEVPSGVQHLRSLKVLANYDMPSEFVLGMQPDGGSNYVKVQHIPSVHFWYRVEGRSYVLYQLGEPELLDRLQGSASNIDDTAQREVRLSFSYSDDEEDSASTLNDVNRLSFCSSRVSVYSDDFVE